MINKISNTALVSRRQAATTSTISNDTDADVPETSLIIVGNRAFRVAERSAVYVRLYAINDCFEKIATFLYHRALQLVVIRHVKSNVLIIIIYNSMARCCLCSDSGGLQQPGASE